MKKVVSIMAALAAILTFADIARNGPPRDIRSPGMKIRIAKDGGHGFIVEEDVPIFRATLATIPYPEYLLNYAEHKQLAVEVARTVAYYFGSTNDIRIAHLEQPHVANTNDLGEVVAAWLKSEWVTDEIIPATRKVGEK